MTEDEMVRQHHWLDGHVFEQALGVGDGQGSLACCSPRGRKESDTTSPNSLLQFSSISSVFPSLPTISNSIQVLQMAVKRNQQTWLI